MSFEVVGVYNGVTDFDCETGRDVVFVKYQDNADIHGCFNTNPFFLKLKFISILREVSLQRDGGLNGVLQCIFPNIQ